MVTVSYSWCPGVHHDGDNGLLHPGPHDSAVTQSAQLANFATQSRILQQRKTVREVDKQKIVIRKHPKNTTRISTQECKGCCSTEINLVLPPSALPNRKPVF